MPLLNAICVSLCAAVIGFCLGVIYTDPSKNDTEEEELDKERQWEKEHPEE